jgi:Na+/proline symporter
MSTRAAALSGLVIGGLVLLVAWLFDVSVGHVVLLAPVVVLVFAAVAGLAIFWFRAAADSLRESKHPRMIVGAAAAVVVLGVVLTVLGVELPRE